MTDALKGTIERHEITGANDKQGVLLPAQPHGVEFLRENNAWGFVNMNEEPDFVAMYISGSEKMVRYFAWIADIVDAENAELARPLDKYQQFSPGKKVIEFKSGSLYELEDPIPYRERTPYSLRYIKLGDFRKATGTNNLF